MMRMLLSRAVCCARRGFAVARGKNHFFSCIAWRAETMRRLVHSAALAAAVLLGNSLVARAAVFYQDDFNAAGSSANYTVVSTDPTSSFPTYAYDYSAMGIPSAPNSGGSTKGLRLDANFSAPAAAEGITLH